MVSEEGGRGRRGGHARCFAAGATRITSVILIGSTLWAAAPGGLAQERRSENASRAGQQMEQALRALGRGLSDRAKELGAVNDGPLATGSIRSPFPDAWIAPTPLPQVARFEPWSAVVTGSDFGRLFDPDLLGVPEQLRRPQRVEEAALPKAPVAEPRAARRPAEPPVAAVPAPPLAAPAPDRREHASLPEPQLPPPAPPGPLTPPPAVAAPQPAPTATLPPPAKQAALPDADVVLAKPPAGAAPRAPGRPVAPGTGEEPQPEVKPAAKEAPRPTEPKPQRSAAHPREDLEVDVEPTAKDAAKDAGKPASRRTPERTRAAARPEPDRSASGDARERSAARPSDDSDTEAEPKAKDAQKPASRRTPERTRAAARPEPERSAPVEPRERSAARPVTAPKAAAKRAPLGDVEVTGSIARSAPARLQARAQPERIVRDARRPATDIPVIALPDALRPTRPPAGSPL